MTTSPASGRSRPAIRRSVVVLPAPVGPSSTTNSPSAIESERSRTASTSPKRLLTAVSARSATGGSLVEGCLEGAAARGVEDRDPIVIEAEPYRLADACSRARRQPRLHLAIRDRDGDDLGRAKLLDAE